MDGVIFFIIFSLVNVVLQTFKTILTARAGKHSAAIINAVTFGFYTVVVKQLAIFPLEISVPVTVITNLIGVYFSIWLLGKLRKDDLWKVSVTASNTIADSIMKKLDAASIDAIASPLASGKSMVVDIFSPNQDTSIKIKEILSKYAVKFHVTEITKTL